MSARCDFLTLSASALVNADRELHSRARSERSHWIGALDFSATPIEVGERGKESFPFGPSGMTLPIAHAAATCRRQRGRDRKRALIAAGTAFAG
jgi:hypothetical protein